MWQDKKMTEIDWCPYRPTAEKVLGGLSRLRPHLEENAGAAMEHAAKINRLATEDPLTMLDGLLSPDDANNAVVYLVDQLSMLGEAADKLREKVEPVCRQAGMCGMECVKRTVALEAIDTLDEMLGVKTTEA